VSDYLPLQAVAPSAIEAQLLDVATAVRNARAAVQALSGPAWAGLHDIYDARGQSLNAVLAAAFRRPMEASDAP
jgi:hypothetical protein